MTPPPSGPADMLRRSVLLLVPLFCAILPASLAALQAGSLGSQNLRPYGYLFAAYALAWFLIMGWIFLLARRIGRLSDRLRE